ncbi:MAG: hypothetical protein R3B91_04395 [Planctomycetaceae bacterium]
MSQSTMCARIGLSALLLMTIVGCATLHSTDSDLSLNCDSDASMQFERGRPNVVIDGIGWVFGIPSRIALWNWDVENHNISADTEFRLEEYVADNNLHDVKVRLNQYDPGGEWRRLTTNHRVSPGWRYTVGTVSLVGYTLLPGRLFGNDAYNPFTKIRSTSTLMFSDRYGGSRLRQDVRQRSYPGTYAVSQLIPGFNLSHETLATRDVITYVSDRGEIDQEREAVNVLYPRYGSVVGSAIETYLPAGGVIELGGLLAGHATGRFKTRRLSAEIADSDSMEAPATSPIQTVRHEEFAPTTILDSASRSSENGSE